MERLARTTHTTHCPIFAGGRLQAQVEAAALTDARRLARLRYDSDLASQLDAGIARHEALRAQRAAVADLYRALGG
jgi:outer membrane protein TolC